LLQLVILHDVAIGTTLNHTLLHVVVVVIIVPKGGQLNLKPWCGPIGWKTVLMMMG
jgi:hypothetical protein